jgi:hypothetical protein
MYLIDEFEAHKRSELLAAVIIMSRWLEMDLGEVIIGFVWGWHKRNHPVLPDGDRKARRN